MTRRRAQHRVLAVPSPGWLWIVAWTVGCSDDYRLAGMRGGPTFFPLDSIVLQVPAAASFGGELRFARDSVGRRVVVDTDRWMLFYFDRAGTLLRSFPVRPSARHRGAYASGLAFLPGDSLVAIHDWGAKEFRVYRLGDGELRFRASAPMRQAGQHWSWRRGAVYLGAGLFQSPVVRWTGNGEAVVPVGETPRRHLAAAGVYFSHGPPEVVATDSVLVVAMPTEPGLWILDSTGQVGYGVMIPALLRRGTPPGYLEHEAAPRRSRWGQMTGSAVRGLFPRDSGELLLWYSDRDLLSRDSVREPILGNYRSYLSVIAPGLDRVCLDAPLPASSDAPHVIAATGDIVEVLHRRSVGPGLARLVIQQFKVTTEACEWVPTRRWKP